MITNETKKRYNAFWEHNLSGGCLMYAICTQPHEYYSKEYPPEELHNRWFDSQRRLSDETSVLNLTKYYADAIPHIFTNFGPGAFSACIGGDFTCAEHTIWFDQNPIIKSYSDMPKIGFDKKSVMFKGIVDYTTALCRASKNTYFTSMTDLGLGLDIIGSLRGTSELLMDLYDNPEQIKVLDKDVTTYWIQVYDYLYNFLQKYQQGMTSWMPIWCGGRYYPLQSDFSAMISPDMFKEFALTTLKTITEFLDYSVFHLDGVDMICHLDHLLSLPRLDAIQWTAGAGKPNELDECWFDMFNKIQKAGRNVIVLCEANVEKTEKLLKAVNPNQLFILSYTSDEYTAESIAELARKITS